MSRRLRGAGAAALAALALAGAAGCGGGADPPSAGPSTVPPPGAGPCAAALAAGPGFAAAPAALRARPADKDHRLGQDVRDPRGLLALHRLWRQTGVAARASGARAARAGDLLVLADDGTLVAGANPFDLRGRGLRFEPNAEGGYDVRAAGAGFRPDLGRRLTLADDDTSEQPLGFGFPFYREPRRSAFVNSDGNLSFGAGDVATDERSLGRVLAGPPRVAPFFADLDPSAGGGVFVSAAEDAFTVTWCAVPAFGAARQLTAQVSLLPGGAVELRIDAATDLEEGVVALSPGGGGGFAPVDLSAADGSPAAGGAAAVGERFAAKPTLDLVAAARRVYGELPDSYDQLVFWTDTPATSQAFAFESTVRNAIAGIGADQLDLSASYGSGGRLESVLMMDDLGKYPQDPGQRANGESTTLALVAHETGHRWGATLRFRGAGGASSDAWLGRQLAHWSFYCDSDASVLEGNDIEDRGGGSFATVGSAFRYGPMDLYAMGLLAPSEVPPAFFVESPQGASQTRESPPRTGVTFSGTRREVRIEDVVAALGPRDPPSRAAPRSHRQAWVYVVGRGRAADPAALAKLDAIRRAFPDFFAAATGGRMSVETRLD